MPSILRKTVKWMVTPQEIIRSDAIFDVSPIVYPVWWIIDVFIGGPPRLVRHVRNRLSRRTQTKIE